ncbi:clusterin-associated protein 1 [Patella vulgata]|uniref:clusterin-associated protein 1 n=1 Tax=Patella vulgata TaxID=6465 RepID=UPI0021806673|nr:clusterin-associated protein 1 [Patella vulgata]
MSFRDLRNFTEMMRALGYRRLISIENFRTPNFPLVAEVLTWLVKRFEPNADIHNDIDTEQDRVIFIKNVAEFMATKAHIKLNTKKLYQADGYSVKELLKVTSVLYSAVKTNVEQALENADEESSTVSFDVSSRISDLKEARMLASTITTKGAALYDLLGKEVDLREIRVNVIAKSLEVDEVERGLKGSIKAVENDIKKTLTMLDNVASDEANLEAKIDKRKNEMERNQKRLMTLQSVRPAYMDEYERFEEDLQKLYAQYLIKFRNLTYLEQQLEEQQKSDQDKVEETDAALKVMAEKIKNEERKQHQITPDDDDDDDEDDKDMFGPDDDSEEEVIERRERPVNHRIRPEGRPAAAGQRGAGGRVAGSMNPDLSDDSQSDGSGDSDIDLDDDDDDDDDDDLVYAPPHAQRARGVPPKTELGDSDNDF